MRLFIIGNGFDLDHGLKTSFQDFKRFIEKTYLLTFNTGFLPYPVVGTGRHGEIVVDPNTSSQILYNLLESVPIESDWRDFEDCLGKLDYHFILDLVDEDEDNPFRHQYNIEDTISDLKPSILVAVFDVFKEWISSIDISKTKRKYYFKDSDYFLTFNFTSVLEDVYSIRKENICHIHGPFQDGHCVTGHGNYSREFDDYDELIKYQIKDISDSLIKHVDELFENQRDFFRRLMKNNITEIVFFGFSFGDVDLFYIRKLFTLINTKNINLYLSAYEDLKSKEEKLIMLKSLGFKGNYKGAFRRIK